MDHIPLRTSLFISSNFVIHSLPPYEKQIAWGLSLYGGKISILTQVEQMGSESAPQSQLGSVQGKKGSSNERDQFSDVCQALRERPSPSLGEYCSLDMGSFLREYREGKRWVGGCEIKTKHQTPNTHSESAK